MYIIQEWGRDNASYLVIELHTVSDSETTKHAKTTECVRALKGLALPRASHYSEIALAGSRRLHSMLAATPFLLAHAQHTKA